MGYESGRRHLARVLGGIVLLVGLVAGVAGCVFTPEDSSPVKVGDEWVLVGGSIFHDRVDGLIYWVEDLSTAPDGQGALMGRTHGFNLRGDGSVYEYDYEWRVRGDSPTTDAAKDDATRSMKCAYIDLPAGAAEGERLKSRQFSEVVVGRLEDARTFAGLVRSCRKVVCVASPGEVIEEWYAPSGQVVRVEARVQGELIWAGAMASRPLPLKPEVLELFPWNEVILAVERPRAQVSPKIR